VNECKPLRLARRAAHAARAARATPLTRASADTMSEAGTSVLTDGQLAPAR